MLAAHTVVCKHTTLQDKTVLLWFVICCQFVHLSPFKIFQLQIIENDARDSCVRDSKFSGHLTSIKMCPMSEQAPGRHSRSQQLVQLNNFQFANVIIKSDYWFISK